VPELEERKFKTPDGITLVADIGGPVGAPAVILLHGGGQTRHSWSGAMRRLVDDGYHVVNYDARGHGASDWASDGNYSVDAIASDLKAVINAVPGPAALVGASMGGIASFYAIGTSERPIARALVMVDVTIRATTNGAERILNFMTANSNGFATLEEVADAVAAYNPDRPRPQNPEGLLKNLRKKMDGRYHWHWDPKLIEAALNGAPDDFTFALAAVSKRVTVPVLLVRGGRSDVVTDETVADMQQQVPQTEVHVVAGAGHMVAGDRNDAFNDGVIDFLRRHHPAR
jgi:pimeloyl-ACP methyl ester carboxylesterase